MKRTSWIHVMALLCLGFGSSGCAYFAQNPRLQPAEATTYLNEDLPIPAGFEQDQKATWRHERSAFRRFKSTWRREGYLGSDRVAEFIKDQYTRQGWTVGFQYGAEPYHFILYKGAEECRIDVTEDFGDRITEIQMAVEPRTTPEGGFVGRQDWSEGEEAPTSTPGSSK